jgi:hypothetical protein
MQLPRARPGQAISFSRDASPYRLRKRKGGKTLEKVIRPAVEREITSRLSRKLVETAWQITVRVFDDKIDMCLLVDVVEKRKRRREDEDTQCPNKAKKCDQQTLVTHDTAPGLAANGIF